jgi:hypothetical protein
MGDLRKIVDYTMIFDDLEECQHFLKETQGITTFLVVFSSRSELEIDHLKDIRNKEGSTTDRSKSRVSLSE